MERNHNIVLLKETSCVHFGKCSNFIYLSLRQKMSACEDQLFPLFRSTIIKHLKKHKRYYNAIFNFLELQDIR